MAKAVINRKKAAKEFADFWKNKGDERQETARFWIGLLEKVLGMENPAERIEFEKKVQLKHTSFIDAYIPETKILIEQKSVDVDLRKETKQSDGAMLTPYRQAKRYADEMPNSLRPNWIIVCNFREFLIYDMERPQGEPVQILLEDLPDKFECLQFMVDSKKISASPEEQVSLKAGELVGKLYDALIKEYIPPTSLNRHSERSEESERSFAYAQDDKLSDLQLRSLNILCVRIVFCLYAEDAGLFETRTAFEDYIKSFSLENLRRGIMDLFKILNTKPENRDKYDTKINSFPYVNGGLFAEREIEIPRFNEEIVDILVNKASAGFDWSKISPTIFGAVFESTLNPETRRKGGMHYTSIANIHKVIDPLFLDDLKAEFASIVGTRHSERSEESQKDVSRSFNMTVKTKNRLEQFRNKLASLTFLDPACGSGNFLTETYISLRRLENECLKVIHGSQMLLSSSDFSPIKVKISQFYGIEINDFAVTVAKTALWIAESQMMKETEEIVEQDLDFLPLSTSATIVEGNALRMDWSTLETEIKNDFVFADRLNVYKIDEKSVVHSVREPEVPYNAHYTELNVVTPEITEKEFPEKDKKSVIYDYIIGNPPFVGYAYQTKEQKEDLHLISKDIANNIDYVSGWYFKAAQFIKNAQTRCAFVSTNSITQGEQVSVLWKSLFEKYNLHIDFAWRTFKWANETSDKSNMAAVHCVVIGFSVAENTKQKIIFLNQQDNIKAENINGYLLDAPNIFIDKNVKPLCNVPLMIRGSSPVDDGNFLLTSGEKDDYLKKEPQGEKFLRPFMMGKDFIDRRQRWCFWLAGADPSELRKCPILMKRIGNVRTYRLKSTKAATVQRAEMPTLFGEMRPCESDYIAIPKVSSEQRRYIPIDYLKAEVLAGDKLFQMPHATLYHFGVLTSSVHNAWMRTVCGRLEMRYSYSNTIVYNNFPWPDLSGSNTATSPKRRGREIEEKIEQTAQAILDARAKYPDSSLADLYDETTMPPELRKAHKENDKAVMQAYGFNQKMSESEIVAELFKMYEKLTEKK